MYQCSTYESMHAEMSSPSTAASEQSTKRKITSAGRSGRVVTRLQQAMKSEKYYEAHQTVRVLYQRYSAQNRDKDATEMLLTGARFLLQHRQWESGTDLAILLMSHLKTHKHPISDDLIENITELFNLYDNEEKEAEPCQREDRSTRGEGKPHVDIIEHTNRENFMKAALKWTSVTSNGVKYGHTKLHKLLALAYWKEKVYEKASDHFMYAGIPAEYGSMLVEFATLCGYPSEVELFITQAVLQLLVIDQKDEAFATLLSYCGKHPATKDQMPPPFQNFPLLNFTWFLLLSIDIGNSEVFQYLCDTYSSAIDRDPLYCKYLKKIGVQYFGMPEPPKEAKSANGLLDLFTGSGLENIAAGLPSFLSSPPAPPPNLPDMAAQDATDALD